MRRTAGSAVLMFGIGALLTLGVHSAMAAQGQHAHARSSVKGTVVAGKITAVDPDGKLVTISEKGKDVQVAWTDDTRVAWRSGKEKPAAAAPTDLKVGEQVMVRAEKNADGVLVAHSIMIRKGVQPPETSPSK